MDYSQAGVNLDAAGAAVDALKSIVQKTYNARTLTPLGGFGGSFSIENLGIDDPVLVATTDGVGTKTEVARAGARFKGLGHDLVAMCLDDLVCTGARPLFFLDYIAVGRNDPALIAEVVSGMTEALIPTGTALIGGEIAEHPGVMEPGEIDLAGFAVGVVSRQSQLGPDRVHSEDLLVGITSPNLRANGFSLVRAIYADVLSAVARGEPGPLLEGSDTRLYDHLIAPSTLYTPMVLPLIEAGHIHAAAHITGGGIQTNLARVLPEKLTAMIDPKSWTRPPIFDQLARDGEITKAAMEQTFNLGIGMILIIPPTAMKAVCDQLPSAQVIGSVVEANSGLGRVQWTIC
ncbi:MAG: phosphoribosylformylglycinamidine cyclo-ligase [Ferrimicrobium sp.]